ncbi:MAG: tRNA (N6-isopentenyl adenosine(37)-C2)-methylthiotransferase MiaB [bacterium]
MFNKINQLQVFIKTFGCQMNFHDSEKMAGILKEAGYQITLNPENSNVIILNTCSIRSHAEEKVYSQMGRFKELKENKPSLILGISGCVAKEKKEKLFKKIPYLDFIIGPDTICELPSILEKIKLGTREIQSLDDDTNSLNLGLKSVRLNKIKAFVSIMKGCNNFCTYCIVPFVRGKEVSRESKEILDEINHLVKQGIIEITLLGQNVNSYGKDLEENINFADLLNKCSQIENLKRIRFVTSHPKDTSLKLIEVMAKKGNVCENLHLPLQSGSDKILELMNRKHKIKNYIDIIQKIREFIPDISITTDLIVGFPQETDEDFEKTLEVVKQIQFDAAFTFKYSIRLNTPASLMSGQVLEEIKQKRLEKLIQIQREISLKKNNDLIGKKLEVLFENISKKNDKEIMGRTCSNKIVIAKGDFNLIGKFAEVQIKETTSVVLIGEIK